MTRIAILSDIHSNIFALEAVLKDVETRNVDMIVNLGDTLLGPIDPVSTAERLMGLKQVINIMGNGDELLLQDKISSASYDFTKPLLTGDMLTWLAGFKRKWTYENILFCHASPHSNSEYLLEQVTAAGLVNKKIEQLRDELKDLQQNYIVCGHSHMAKTLCVSENLMVINPGSVGLPAYTDDEPYPHAVETFSPHAKYAVLTKHDGVVTKIEHVAIEYDWHKASEMAKNNGRDDYAYPLKTGLAMR